MGQGTRVERRGCNSPTNSMCAVSPAWTVDESVLLNTPEIRGLSNHSPVYEMLGSVSSSLWYASLEEDMA